MRLDARVDVGEGADRTRDGAGRDLGARGDQARLAARKFGIGLGELETEGDGFGVDAVAAADRRGQLVLVSAAPDRGEQRIEVGKQYIGRSEEHTSELQSLMR